jgi:hypothetical protein
MKAVRILHTSDLHLPKHGDPERGAIRRLLDALRGSLGDYDVWVDSGDLLPDPPASIDPQRVSDARMMPEAHEAAARWQLRWMERVAPHIVEALGDRRGVVIDGNHHWMNAAHYLDTASAGRIAYAQHGEAVEVASLRWTGLPFIPSCGGCFRREVEAADWSDILGAVPPADVLVSHAPPAGPLSVYDEWGVPWDRCRRHAPVVLCGHIHQTGGREASDGWRVVNGACRMRIIEIEAVSG